VVDGEQRKAPDGLAVGSQIAGYQIEEQIGQGGMAVVYRASDLSLNRVVALKILAPELARDVAFRERFIREMRAAAAVDHPHIVPVFDAGEANGALFIAMLYAGGRDVRSLISTDLPLPAARVADIVGQVASALDAAHARGLIHRDVKPANMLLAESGGDGRPDHVYLSDFGLSKQSFSSASLTLTGQFLGTLDYMAPEQVEGSPIDGRADLYGLACACYEMFTGTPPFRRDHNFAAIWAQLSAPAPSLLTPRPDLNPAIDQVIRKALAKSPDDRYPTCGDFAGALREACELTPALAQASGPESAARPPWPQAQPAHLAAGRQAAAPQPTAVQRPLVASGQAGPHGGGGESMPTVRQRPLMPSTDADLGDASWPAGWARGAASGPAGDAAPAGSPWPSHLGGPGALWPGGGLPGEDGQPPLLPGYQAGGPRRSRPRGALIAGFVVLLAIIAIAVVLVRGGASRTQPPTSSGTGPGHSASPSQPSSSSQPPSGSTSPAATVQAFFTAINSRDYAKAWTLGGQDTGQSYQSFVQGFASTAHDDLTIVSVSGNIVTIQLAATQTNGTVQNYQGTYTVNNGTITASHIQSVS
jgi:tRNA A-37 threonylcarbamoyl transferase component Bud32